MTGDQLGDVRKLTPEEVRRGLEAMERLSEVRDKIMAERGGKLFSSSLEILDEMREERTRALP